jgi:hypothetical protein
MSVLVTEGYREWRPPIDGRRTVEHLLRQVSETHLAGLREVSLTNAGGLARKRRRARTWTRKRKIAIGDARGLYHGAWKGEPPWIELFVDRICDGFPAWVFKLPLMRDLVFADVLFHEIGHHIHATTQKEHADRELVADRWRGALAGPYFRRRYWYLRPVFALARWLRRWTS